MIMIGATRGMGTDDGDRPRPPEAAVLGGEARTVPDQLRILIVEDEVFVRMDIETIVRHAGHSVVASADTADQAVKLADAHRPDVVLMDIRLRGMRDGIDAAIEIYDRFGIRSLFVSANVEDDTRLRAGPAEPLGFLAKPFSASQLLAALRRPR